MMWFDAVGCATIHSHDTVHGVTTLEHGTRYSLFLCDTRGPSLDALPLEGLLQPTMQVLSELSSSLAHVLYSQFILCPFLQQFIALLASSLLPLFPCSCFVRFTDHTLVARQWCGLLFIEVMNVLSGQ